MTCSGTSSPAESFADLLQQQSPPLNHPEPHHCLVQLLKEEQEEL